MAKPKLIDRVAGFLAMYLFLEALSFLCLLASRKLIDVTYQPALVALTAQQKKSLSQFLTRAGKDGTPYALLDRNTSVAFDGPLGWVTAASDANSAGMRDDREYSPSPQPGIARFSAFGDSFTYGFEVPMEAAWTRQMTAMAPFLECLNYGVPAYGIDQAYLRYLKVGSAYHPNAVFIGYMSEDLFRSVNVFRPFYWDMGWLFTKPRFKVSHDSLTLLPNPLSAREDYQNFLLNDSTVLRRLGQNDYYYQTDYLPGRFDVSPSVRLGKVLWRQVYRRFHEPVLNRNGTYNVASEAYRVTVRVLDAFYRRVLEDGALPIIVVFPEANDVQRRRQGEMCSYAPLLEYFRGKGYRFIDVQNAFSTYTPGLNGGGLFTGMAHSHLTPAGNALVAKYLLGRLNDWNLADGAHLRQAAQVERRR